jgi:3-oxoacyl-[acyl-carrier protein] reductase
MTKSLNIVVTGASSGIGFQTSLKLAGMGHTVYALARREDKLKELVRQNQGTGEIIAVPIDLASFSKTQLDQVFGNIKTIDRLVNNAGKLLNKPFLTITEEEIDSVLNLNYTSVIKLIQYFHPKLVTSNSPHIVNIGSVGGVTGSVKFPGLSVYSSSKGALSILSECLSVDFLGDGIIVNCLALGSVNTEMLKEAFPDFVSPTSSEDISRYISHFVLEGNSVVNGVTQVISVSNP